MSDWGSETYSEQSKPCPSCGKDMIRAGYLTFDGRRSWQYLPVDCNCFTSFSESEARPEALQLDHIACMDVMDYLKTLPDGSVDCVVTSPPYLNLRRYLDPSDPNSAKEFGQEATPEEYVARLVGIFREIKRVLKSSGVAWLNIGDSFWNSTFIRSRGSETFQNKGDEGYDGYYAKNGGGVAGGKRRSTKHPILKQKDLIMLPARVAIALVDDGWYLRSEIVWSKGNCLPESIVDRPTRSHEMIYLLTKARHYWYDAEAIKTPAKESSVARVMQPNFANQTGGEKDYGKTGVNTSRSMRKTIENWANKQDAHENRRYTGFNERYDGNPAVMSNVRSVWEINTEPSPYAHFATMPTKLVERCIKAGCPDKVCTQCGKPWTRIVQRTGHVNKREVAHAPNSGPTKVDSTGWAPVSVATDKWQPTCKCNADHRPGIVLDPFMGSGTVAIVARANGRNYIGTDLNMDYVNIAKERLRAPFESHHIQKETDLRDLPLFQGVGD